MIKKASTAATIEPHEHITITLEGVKYTLQPSLKAVMAMEAATSRSLFQLGQLAAESALSLSETGILCAEMIRAWGEATGDTAASHVGAQRIGELAMGEGTIGAQIKLAVVLGYAVSGGYDAAGNPKLQGTLTTGMTA